MIDSDEGGSRLGGSTTSILTMNLLDVYYTRLEVGCQVNFNHRFHRFSQINADFVDRERMSRWGEKRSELKWLKGAKVPKVRPGIVKPRRGARGDVSYCVCRPFDAAQGRIAYLAERRGSLRKRGG